MARLISSSASGAVSCTGCGESIVRMVLARRAAERLERGESASEAAARVVAELAERVAGLGWLIVVSSRDAAGGSPVGVAFNTTRMARAYRVEGAQPVILTPTSSPAIPFVQNKYYSVKLEALGGGREPWRVTLFQS